MHINKGITLKIAATLSFTLMAAGVRAYAQRFPTGELVFFRSFFALVPLFAILGVRGHMRDAFTINSFSAHARRVTAGLGGMVAGFAALSYLPLADATALGYVTPLVLMPLSVIMLGEPLRSYKLLAVMLGFIGVMIMLSPHLGADSNGPQALLGAGFGLVGAVLSAVAQVQVKQISGKENASAIVFIFMSTAALAALVTAPFGWVMPTWSEALGLIVIGVLGGLGQILVTHAYRFAPASTLSPFDYTTMIWAVLLGYALFGDFPAPVVFTGMGIVVLAGLYVALRDGQESEAEDEEVATGV